MRTSYQHTIYACYIGHIVQAIINNFAPLLFLTFHSQFGIPLEQIGLITSFNFIMQFVTDIIAVRLADRIGYRRSMIIAHILAAAGLLGMSLLPEILPNPFAGLLVGVALYAMGSGTIEVLLSPTVEACPTERKAAAMSLLHSFYCWGQMGVILVCTLFFATVGVEHWQVLGCLLAVIPLANCFYFAVVPFPELVPEGKRLPLRTLLSKRMFWFMVVLMLCAGAAELSMAQWASAFAESGLHVSKTVGDLFGPCLFAALMGLGRLFFGVRSGTWNLHRWLCLSAALCIVCYLTAALVPSPVMGLLGCAVCGLSVALMWPGTFSLAAERMPTGGTALFALLSLAGDVGCSVGPGMVGLVSGGDLHIGLLAATIFPVILLAVLLAGKRHI